jgi:hypothetical protein
MHYIPGAEKLLDRFPLFTAMLFAAFCAVFGWYGSVQSKELRGFATGPQTVAVDRTITPTRGGDFAIGQWVELEGDLKFDCGSTSISTSGTLEGYLFGHASETYVAATDPRGQRMYVFVLDRTAICEDAMRKPWRGVLRKASRYDLDRVSRNGRIVPASLTQPPIRFETYGGPKETRKMLVLTVFAFVLTALGATMFWFKHRALEAKKESEWAGSAWGSRAGR